MTYNFTFKKIKKTDILMIDKDYSELKLGKHKKEIFDYKTIYLHILFKSLFLYFLKNKNKKLKDIYLKLYFQKLNPKIIIGHQANGLIYEVKRHSPKSKIIAYLHCRLYLFQFGEVIDYLKKNSSADSQIDYFFVCDQIHINYLKNYTKAKFLIGGLLKNNEIKLKKRKYKYDIAYVSEYRNTVYPKKEKHFYYMKYIAKILNEYALKNPNKNIVIILNSLRKDKKIPIQEEIDFFKKCSPDLKIAFDKSSYDSCNLSKLLIILNSNLGAEFLSRGKKVLFLPYLNKLGIIYYNLYFKKNISFASQKLNKRIIFNKIQEISKLSTQSWKKKVINSKINIKFDQNNKKFKKLINKIIKDHK